MQAPAPSTLASGTGSRLARTLHATTRFRRLAGVSRRIHIAIFRTSRGRVMGKWFGSPVLVLETVGRRSRKRRQATMTYLRTGDGYVVIPINAGSERVPAWWLNLRESGRATIIVRDGRLEVQAREAEGEEADRLWRRYGEQAPAIEHFRLFAGRPIPVVVLERVDG